MTTTSLSRRQCLKGSGALIVSFNLFPPASNLFAQSSPASGGEPDPTQLDSWIAIGQDGSVTIFTSKVELGTGIETALAQIAAEELDVSWRKIKVDMGDTSKTIDQATTSGTLDRSTARCRRLVDGLRGISHVDFDFSPRNIQLFRGDLRQGGLDAGAELDFAGKNCNAAVLTDGDPGIELCRIGFSTRSGRRLREQVRCRGKEIEADDQRAAAFEKLSARERCCCHNILLLHQLSRGPLDRAENADMRAAAAQVAGQGFFDLAVGRLGVLVEQSLGAHDHAVDTVAALHGLFIDEGLLELVHLFGGAQTFEGGDRAVLSGADLGHAGTDGIAVHDDGAGAALRHAATILRSVELEIVAQNVKQRGFRVRIDDLTLAIHLEWNSRHRRLLRLRT